MEKQRETLKTKQKMPLFRGETGFSSKTKERKQKENETNKPKKIRRDGPQKNKTKKNKEV